MANLAGNSRDQLVTWREKFNITGTRSLTEYKRYQVEQIVAQEVKKRMKREREEMENTFKR